MRPIEEVDDVVVNYKQLQIGKNGKVPNGPYIISTSQQLAQQSAEMLVKLQILKFTAVILKMSNRQYKGLPKDLIEEQTLELCLEENPDLLDGLFDNLMYHDGYVKP